MAGGARESGAPLTPVSTARIVQCHGCFDLLHLGHIRHLQAARDCGDYLIVTITPDQYVNKGPGRPMFTAEQRAEAVRALSCVDEVRITDYPTAAQAIRDIKPDVFVKGPDYSAETLDSNEAAALQDVGGTLVITQTEKWSSTALQRDAGLSEEARTYLATMRAKYRPSDVKVYLDKAKALKVLVVGDAIRDEYHYVDTLGKSGKDPILAAQLMSVEAYAGGVIAVLKHVQAVADVATSESGRTLTVKRRFVERYPFQKLFEVYQVVTDSDWEESDLSHVGDYDVVVVADYGHGFLTTDRIDRLEHRAKYLAVNVQANAGNHGFNTISKYERAEFISVSERELRLDARDQAGALNELAWQSAVGHQGTVLVTRGEKGCMAVQSDGPESYAPALTTHAVDRTGAGDAVFAVTACLAAVGTPLDLLTFVASIVGTQAVGIVGNARYIERESLWAAIEQALA